jgi:hypothetical protein
MGGDYLTAFTVGDQLLWGAAEPLRRMLGILLALPRQRGDAAEADTHGVSGVSRTRGEQAVGGRP